MTMTSDPLEVLLEHNHWATRKVLELCRGLTREQFHKPYPIGPGQHGGLHATLTHVLFAMERWADFIAGRPPRPSRERPPLGPADGGNARDLTPDELIELLDASTADLRTLIRNSNGRRETLVTVRFGETSYTFTLGASFAHALTHGHYHRAQCMNMLRQLNVTGVSDKLTDLDVVDWQYEVEGARSRDRDAGAAG